MQDCRKGYTMACPVTDFLIRTCNTLALAIGCNAYIKKVGRCTTAGAKAADALSKANFELFAQCVLDHDLEPRKIPKSVLKWIMNPVEDEALVY